MIQIHLTTGDLQGIGLEITIKALLSIPPKKNVQFILWRSNNKPSFLQPLFRKLHKHFFCQTFDWYPLEKHSKSIQIIDIASKENPVEWVKSATLLCLKNKTSMALVTAPLSKIQMQKDGYSFRGHTELLKYLSRRKNLYMCFLGENFNVVLATDHQPLQKVHLQKRMLNDVIEKILSFRSFVQDQNKPIGLLGLNPHAGEEGVLGFEERDILDPVIKKWKPQVQGPLVPDTAFFPCFWKKYSFYLCMYHDQGLIPFKMIHQRQGVHTTLALPFIRTSVDHGTAKDLFGQNKADFSSMKKAIEKALTLSSGF